MKSFLRYTATYLIEKHRSDFQNIVVLMPNRRSCLFLERELTSLLSETSWLPQIISLNDWLKSKASLNKIDELLAIVKLYNVFKNVYSNSNISFDEFYFTGQILLNDFNDIDAELVDAEKLFVNLQDLKEISDKFAFDQDFFIILSDYILLFEKDFSNNKSEQDSNIQSYIKIWQGLFQLYSAFRKDLINENQAYDGLLIRYFIENDVEKLKGLNNDKFYIVGFNALSRAEERLFEKLKTVTSVSFLWEYDNEYIDNEQYSAGLYLRKLIKKFPIPEDFKINTDNLGHSSVKVVALPNEISMAKYAVSQLSNNEQDIALVLADESLLPVILNSLPVNIGKVNVTMGFPIKQTVAYTFIKQLFKLRQQLRKSNNKIWIARNSWLELLYHPFLYDNESVQNQINFLIKDKTSSLTYIDLTSEKFIQVSNNQVLTKLYELCNDLTNVNFLELLLQLLHLLEIKLLDNHTDMVEIELEIQALRKVYNAFSTFKDLLDNNNIEIADSRLFDRLLNQILQNQKIDLFGEPLDGLQIMGLMESRLLDFEKVFLLSLNDKVIPGDKFTPTFILYSLRKYFGLSTPEKREAIDAFHFYRLIQRSQEAVLFYSQFIGSEEADKSPYIRQLLFNKKWNISEKYYNDKMGKSPENKSIEIDKKSLGNKWDNFIKSVKEKGFSQNAVSSFIQCPLKFYYERVENLKDDELFPEESLDKDLGLLFHEAVKLLFLNKKEVDIAELEKVKANINETVNQLFAQKYNFSWSQVLLLKEQLISMLDKFFEVELNKNSHFPCEIICLEKDIEAYINNIKLFGRVDMIIKNSGGVFVLDFKTGSEKDVSFDNIDNLFSTNSKLIYAFQLAFYAFLFSKNHENEKEIFAENIYIKTYAEAYKKVLSKKEKVENKKALQKSMLNFVLEKLEFENKIAEIIKNIIDVSQPFVQTTDTKNCEYCNFKLLCRKK